MISLVIPVYGVEKYIVNCLKSVVNQEYKDFELLLVNDGTKDKSVEVINNFLKDYDLNYHIINKENGGLASARNEGIKQAKGEYVAFLDADDAISSDFLLNLFNSLQGKDYDFSFCNFEFTKEQVPPIGDNNEFKVYTREELMDTFLRRGISFVVPSMFFRTSFLKDNDLYFNEKIKFSEDQPFIWNVILHSKKAIYLKKKMYGYYVRENSIMTSSSSKKIQDRYLEYKDYLDVLKKGFSNDIALLNMVLPRWSLGALYTASNSCDYKSFKELYDLVEGRKLFKQTLKIKDLNTSILGFISFLSPRLLYLASRSIKL